MLNTEEAEEREKEEAEESDEEGHTAMADQFHADALLLGGVVIGLVRVLHVMNLAV